MAAQGGFGLTLTLDGTAVVGVRNAAFPEINRIIAEATAHDSDQGYYVAVPSGKKRVNPFAMELMWDANEATHAAVLTALGSATANTITMADPDGDETISFGAFIEGIGRISEQESAYFSTVNVHPSGPPTIS